MKFRVIPRTQQSNKKNNPSAVLPRRNSKVGLSPQAEVEPHHRMQLSVMLRALFFFFFGSVLIIFKEYNGRNSKFVDRVDMESCCTKRWIEMSPCKGG